MDQRQKATLVLKGKDRQLIDWAHAIAADSRVIPVSNANLLGDSLHLAQDFMDVEVVRVVFDQSIEADQWLDFMTSLPLGFRGEVLFVAGPRAGYLSAVGRSDERVLYKLDEEDLDFYLAVSGIESKIVNAPRPQLLAMAV